MGDLLGSLVQGSQKRTILCVIWGGMLQQSHDPIRTPQLSVLLLEQYKDG
jgi:hypothetical protein